MLGILITDGSIAVILKNWFVIVVLSAIGLALFVYWQSIQSLPEGITPQGDENDNFKQIATLAGAITTLGTAVFGVLGKFNDFRARRIANALAELELEKKRKELDAP